MNMRIQGEHVYRGLVYMGEHENTGVTGVYMGEHENTGVTGVYMGEHENTGVYRSIHG